MSQGEERFRFRIQLYDEKLKTYKDIFSFYGTGSSDIKRVDLTPECAEGRHNDCPRFNEIIVGLSVFGWIGKKIEFGARSRCRCSCHKRGKDGADQGED